MGWNSEIYSAVVRFTEVDPVTGKNLDEGYFGAAAYSEEVGIVRAARSLNELAGLVGDLNDNLALFNFVLREWPLGNLDGHAFDDEEMAAWASSTRPVPDPKPFIPADGYPTASEVIRFEDLDPVTGATTETQYGISVRGPFCGTTFGRWCESLEELRDYAGPLESHEARWAAMDDSMTIGTIDGGFRDPITRFIELMSSERPKSEDGVPASFVAKLGHEAARSLMVALGLLAPQ
jgi:hypothetical protein